MAVKSLLNNSSSNLNCSRQTTNCDISHRSLRRGRRRVSDLQCRIETLYYASSKFAEELRGPSLSEKLSDHFFVY